MKATQRTPIVERPGVVLPFQSAPSSARARGPLLDAADVAAQIFNSKCSARWVLDNAPAEYRVKVGKRVLFHAGDMETWKDSMQGVR